MNNAKRAVVDIATNKVYDTLLEAAEAHEIVPGLLDCMLSGKTYNYSSLRFVKNMEKKESKEFWWTLGKTWGKVEANDLKHAAKVGFADYVNRNITPCDLSTGLSISKFRVASHSKTWWENQAYLLAEQFSTLEHGPLVNIQMKEAPFVDVEYENKIVHINLLTHEEC